MLAVTYMLSLLDLVSQNREMRYILCYIQYQNLCTHGKQMLLISCFHPLTTDKLRGENDSRNSILQNDHEAYRD